MLFNDFAYPEYEILAKWFQVFQVGEKRFDQGTLAAAVRSLPKEINFANSTTPFAYRPSLPLSALTPNPSPPVPSPQSPVPRNYVAFYINLQPAQPSRLRHPSYTPTPTHPQPLTAPSP